MEHLAKLYLKLCVEYKRVQGQDNMQTNRRSGDVKRGWVLIGFSKKYNNKTSKKIECEKRLGSHRIQQKYNNKTSFYLFSTFFHIQVGQVTKNHFFVIKY